MKYPTRITPLGLDGQTPAFYDLNTTRALEQQAAHTLGVDALMRRAGQAIADWVLALKPHAQTIWIAAGPGNNGADALVAAKLLADRGKTVLVTAPESNSSPHLKTRTLTFARQEAMEAGLVINQIIPTHYDLCLDGLLGCGEPHPFADFMQDCVTRINGSDAPVLSIDVPSGLHANTGYANPNTAVACATLCLLTLKAGLFTGDGAAHAGEVWFHDLAFPVDTSTDPYARLNRPPSLRGRTRVSNTSKGDFGSVVVLGGAAGMVGAPILAATSALHIGAGRVHVALLDAQGVPCVVSTNPALMPCAFSTFNDFPKHDFVLLAGCGGGNAIEPHLLEALNLPHQLVLDADALNAIATSPALQAALKKRANNTTVLTPHPLEAARLLGYSVTQIQQDRIYWAKRLAKTFHCSVVLKGSGTIIAQPLSPPIINPTGDDHLASAGTGDVLAGMIASLMAQGLGARDAACQAVWQHGDVAQNWPENKAFDAYQLAAALI